MAVRVLGIDPGLTRCGVGIIDLEKTRIARFVAVDVIRTSPNLEIEKRILSIVSAVDKLIEQYSIETIGMEKVFAQKNLHSVMPTAHLSGAVLYLAAQYAIPIKLYTPTEVKAAVTGYGGAEKPQVQHMVARILKLQAIPKPADAADALAVALAHSWRG